MKKRVFNLIILDASGSMWTIREQAISGVNETIQSIRNAQEENPEQEHYFSLVSFNNKVKTIHDCAPIALAEEIDNQAYRPDSMTALYDAMGISLLALDSKVNADDRVLVTIITDGMENASIEFGHTDIKSLVERLKSQGWVFAYIGANHDVNATARKIAIHNTMEFEATEYGTVDMIKKLNSQRGKFYTRLNDDGEFSSAHENENFFKE